MSYNLEKQSTKKVKIICKHFTFFNQRCKIALLICFRTYYFLWMKSFKKLFSLFSQSCNSLFSVPCSLGRISICQFADGQIYCQMDWFLHIVLNNEWTKCFLGILWENLNQNKFQCWCKHQGIVKCLRIKYF